MTVIEIVVGLIITAIYVGLVKILVEEIRDSVKEINAIKENNKDRAKIGWSTDNSYKKEYVNIVIYSVLFVACVACLFTIGVYVF